MPYYRYDFCKNKQKPSEFQSEDPYPKQRSQPYIKIDK